MPIPISHLFLKDEDNMHGMPRQKDVNEMAKGWPNIDIKLSEIPHIRPPDIHSKEFKEDIDQVKSCYYNPMCDDVFLEECHEKPFGMFRRYVVDNGLDYDIDGLDDLNSFE